MINPNAKHSIKGTVSELIRHDDGTIRDIKFITDSGHELTGVLGVEHKTIKQGERVSLVIGFRITSDRYVVESFRRSA